MALYTQVAYGSSGKAVKELQTALNAHGYSLDVDGQFGSKTQAAVRDYQQKNGLRLDGIAGDETWGSLMAAPSAAAGTAVYVPSVSSATAAQLRKLEQGYTPSLEVDAADALRRSLAESQPAAYQSGFDAQLKALFRAGGFVGVNFYPSFLRPSGTAEADTVIDHMAYMCDLGGEDCVGLGSDFDGIETLCIVSANR